MQMFKAKAFLEKPDPKSSLTSATFDIEIHGKYFNSDKALEAVKKTLFIPGTYKVVIKGPDGDRNFKIEVKDIPTPPDRQSASSTS